MESYKSSCSKLNRIALNQFEAKLSSIGILQFPNVCSFESHVSFSHFLPNNNNNNTNNNNLLKGTLHNKWVAEISIATQKLSIFIPYPSHLSNYKYLLSFFSFFFLFFFPVNICYFIFEQYNNFCFTFAYLPEMRSTIFSLHLLKC